MCDNNIVPMFFKMVHLVIHTDIFTNKNDSEFGTAFTMIQEGDGGDQCRYGMKQD